MRPKRLFGSILLALPLLLSIAAVAHATVSFLPAPTTSSPLKGHGSGGTIRLVTVRGAEIQCTSVGDTGEFTSGTKGSGTLEFAGCSSEGAKCKTPGDTAGTILAADDLTLVAEEESGKLLVGALVEPVATVVLTCGVLKIEIKGSLTLEATKYRESSLTETAKAVPMPTAGVAELLLGLLVLLVARESSGKPTFGKHSFEVNFGAGFVEAAIETEVTVTTEEKAHVDF